MTRDHTTRERNERLSMNRNDPQQPLQLTPTTLHQRQKQLLASSEEGEGG